MAKFKIGDRVKINLPGYTYNGKQCIVDLISSHRVNINPVYTVRCDIKSSLLVSEDDLVLISARKFKVGDKVKVNSSRNTTFVGWQGIVTNIIGSLLGDTDLYDVKGIDGVGLYFWEGDLDGPSIVSGQPLPVTAEIRSCKCLSWDLFHYGCRCGES